MESNTTDQILNLIDKSKNILLLTHARADCDGLGAMLSLYLILNKLGKNVTAVTNDPTPENLAFLPSISIVQSSMASSKDFIISLDLSKTPLSKIKYNMEGSQINIIVTSKDGSYTKEDVSFEEGKNTYDLIIILDAGNLEHLGPIYDQNSELFFETPIINIDHHSSNNDFGQVNMVDMVASSTTEVLYHIIKKMEKKYDKKFLTEDISTLLLAGIITDTGSFQHANTSPKSMEVAAQLLDLGARQQEIIKNIYKTKKLSTLKLWGIVLSKVQVDPVYRMVWSTISKDDLQEADADSSESENLIDDLLTNAPGVEVIMLMKYNEEGYTSVSMRSTTNAVDVGQICADMGGGGHVRAAGYKIRDGRPFDQIISEALSKVREYQKHRLNIHQENIDIPKPNKDIESLEIKKEMPKDDKKTEIKEEEKPQSSTANYNSEKQIVTTPQPDKPKKEARYMDFKKPSQAEKNPHPTEGRDDRQDQAKPRPTEGRDDRQDQTKPRPTEGRDDRQDQTKPRPTESAKSFPRQNKPKKHKKFEQKKPFNKIDKRSNQQPKQEAPKQAQQPSKPEIKPEPPKQEVPPTSQPKSEPTPIQQPEIQKPPVEPQPTPQPPVTPQPPTTPKPPTPTQPQQIIEPKQTPQPEQTPQPHATPQPQQAIEPEQTPQPNATPQPQPKPTNPSPEIPDWLKSK